MNMINPNASFANPGSLFSAGRIDANRMRPFMTNDGRTCIVANGKLQEITVNSGTLRHEEWRDLDPAVVEAALKPMRGIADLRSAGLVHNVSFMRSISSWERSSDMTPASQSMDGLTRGEEDTPAFDMQSVPIPVVFKDFRVLWRKIEESRALGDSIDVTAADMAGRKVGEASEDMLFGGSPITVDGNTIYGYTTHPDRNTVDMNAAWSSVTTANNEDIVDEVNEALQAARDDNYFGPFVLYIPGAYESKLDEDYKPGTGDTRTLRARLLQLSGLSDIRVAYQLTGDNVVLVQLTRNVVDLAVAQDVTTVQWQSQGQFVDHFKVFAVWVPRVKSDFDGRSGVVHIRTT